MAQGTKLWSVDRYDEMERGTAEGVAIRSDGRLEAGPATSLLYADGRELCVVGGGGCGGEWLRGYGRDGGRVGGGDAGGARTGRRRRSLRARSLGCRRCGWARMGRCMRRLRRMGRCIGWARGGATAAVVFDPATTAEKPKYLWDLAVGRDGEVYVAAGAPAVVYRVPAGGGKAEVLFQDGGSAYSVPADGGGWDAVGGVGWGGGDLPIRRRGRRGRSRLRLYAAGRKEITSLAMDAAGKVYAAACGSEGAGRTLPPLPVTGNVGVTVTFVQPGSATAASANTLVPEGSEIYRIAADGSLAKLVTLKDDVVYALAVRDGALLAATGNRGRVYRVDPSGAGAVYGGGASGGGAGDGVCGGEGRAAGGDE